jgi:3-oxoadipate enol-lactonase
MKLSALTWGDPQGLPVVLLHAFPLSGAMWEPQREALAGFRVIAPHLRGFGDTPLIGPWLVEHAAADVLETLSGLGIEKAVFVGLSMGGYVALRIAEAAPERLRALVLCDTRAEPDANENKAKRAAAMDFVRKNGVAAFAGPFLKDALADKTKLENPKAVESLRSLASKAAPEAVLHALAALAARPDALPGLSKITVPTAVFVGSQDKLTPLAMSETMRSRIPGAQLHVIPDAGHFSSVENPAAFNERLVSFLKRL